MNGGFAPGARKRPRYEAIGFRKADTMMHATDKLSTLPRSVRWANAHLTATRSRNTESAAKQANHADSRERAHKKRVSAKALRRAMAIETARRTQEAVLEWQMRNASRRPQDTNRTTASGMPVVLIGGIATIAVPVFNRVGVLLGITRQRVVA